MLKVFIIKCTSNLTLFFYYFELINNSNFSAESPSNVSSSTDASVNHKGNNSIIMDKSETRGKNYRKIVPKIIIEKC